MKSIDNKLDSIKLCIERKHKRDLFYKKIKDVQDVSSKLFISQTINSYRNNPFSSFSFVDEIKKQYSIFHINCENKNRIIMEMLSRFISSEILFIDR